MRKKAEGFYVEEVVKILQGLTSKSFLKKILDFSPFLQYRPFPNNLTKAKRLKFTANHCHLAI